MGKSTLAYAQTWPSSGGALVTHHIYRDDSMPEGVMVHQHVHPDDNRSIWIPDGVWERAVKTAVTAERDRCKIAIDALADGHEATRQAERIIIAKRLCPLCKAYGPPTKSDGDPLHEHPSGGFAGCVADAVWGTDG